MELIADADLVHTALLGDKDALGTLIRRHWQTAVFLAARVLGAPELANDAAQEAAIAAMTGLDRLKSPDKFGAWFCGITLNVARRWLRHLNSELPWLDTDVVSDAPGPAEAAELADIAARVRSAIGLLADGQAKAVSLFYLQGLSHREVAAELGISPAAVKARLHQARAALAPKLAGIAGEPERKSMTTSSQPQWVDAAVTEIRLHRGEHEDVGHHIMVLTEAGGTRQLPIWIGPAEAVALAVAIESTEIPRPFTYQLAASLVAAAGATISEVRITRLEPPIFYATVLIEGSDGAKSVDARPSDAVNLALTAAAPIRVDSALFGPDARWADAPQLEDLPVITSDLAEAAVKRFTSFSDPPQPPESGANPG